MKLLALVLLLSVFSSLTLTEVLEDFMDFESSSCSMFFIPSPNSTHITPTVFGGDQYKKICQRWNNKYTFATLYDRKHRIPVYSAYTFSGQNTNLRRNNDWKNEPQLENMNNRPEMREITDAEIDNFFHQAVDRDYRENNLYTRGHVFPKLYAGDQDQADSTFTFTNAAPQTNHSNDEWNKQVEIPMKGVIKNNCKPNRSNPAFIVTGVVPGNEWIEIMRNNTNITQGINIPIYYWTAFCCYSNQDTRISKAYLVRQNEPDIKSYEISYMSVNMLNERLSSLYEQEFKVFGDLCLT